MKYHMKEKMKLYKIVSNNKNERLFIFILILLFFASLCKIKLYISRPKIFRAKPAS